jgi:hypothetical protein
VASVFAASNHISAKDTIFTLELELELELFDELELLKLELLDDVLELLELELLDDVLELLELELT